MLELGIAVGMMRALVGLAVGLTAVTQHRQVFAHAVGTDIVAHLVERRRQLLVALGYPLQGADRIAQRYRLDEAPQIIKERRIVARERPPAATCTTHPAFGQRRQVQVFKTAPDRAAGQPGHARHCRQTAAPRCLGLTGRE